MQFAVGSKAACPHVVGCPRPSGGNSVPSDRYAPDNEGSVNCRRDALKLDGDTGPHMFKLNGKLEADVHRIFVLLNVVFGTWCFVSQRRVVVHSVVV